MKMIWKPCQRPSYIDADTCISYFYINMFLFKFFYFKTSLYFNNNLIENIRPKKNTLSIAYCSIVVFNNRFLIYDILKPIYTIVLFLTLLVSEKQKEQVCNVSIICVDSL
jgi:cytochrome c oxidase subunit IV